MPEFLATTTTTTTASAWHTKTVDHLSSNWRYTSPPSGEDTFEAGTKSFAPISWTSVAPPADPIPTSNDWISITNSEPSYQRKPSKPSSHPIIEAKPPPDSSSFAAPDPPPIPIAENAYQWKPSKPSSHPKFEAKPPFDPSNFAGPNPAPPIPSAKKCTSTRLVTGANVLRNPSFNTTLFPWKLALSGNWDRVDIATERPPSDSFHASSLGPGRDVLFLKQDGVVLKQDTVKIKCSVTVRSSTQGLPCDKASVGFQVFVGGVRCVGSRLCNEVDYVSDATVEFAGRKGDVGDVQLVVDAVGSGKGAVDVWIDDVVVRPVFKECFDGW